MELFVDTQIAANQRKRIRKHSFLQRPPKDCLPLLSAKAGKLSQTTSFASSSRFRYLHSIPENGYDLVTQPRFQVAFRRFHLASRFAQPHTLNPCSTILLLCLALFSYLLHFFFEKLQHLPFSIFQTYLASINHLL